MEQSERYSPWKKPWQKKCALAAAILSILILWSRISEYREFARIGELIFSPGEAEVYLAWRGLSCLTWGLYSLLTIGIFLIGHFSRSQKAFHLGEQILLAFATVLWAWAWMFPFVEKSGLRLLWTAILLVLLAGDIFLLWQKHWKKGKA